MKKIILLCAFVVVATGVYIALNAVNRDPLPDTVPQQTTVGISYSMGDISDLADVTAYINSKQFDPLENEVVLSENSTLRIIKPGYSEFSTSVENTGRQTTIYAKLSPLSDSTMRSFANIKDIGLSPNQFQLGDVEYFHENTWALINISSNITDPAIAIARYNATANIWEIILGPGTGFDYNDTLLVPDAVKRRLIMRQNITGANL